LTYLALFSTYEAGEGQGLAVKLRDFGFASRIARLDDETLRAARNAGATGVLQHDALRCSALQCVAVCGLDDDTLRP